MKKAFVLLLALAVLGGAVFAQAPAYTLTGSASLTWGYDLNTENHGFTNTAAAKLVFPLGANGGKKGDTPITGEITISEFKVGIEATETNSAGLTTTKGAVTAKILFPSNLYLQIASAPSFAINYAANFAPWVFDADTWTTVAVTTASTTAAEVDHNSGVGKNGFIFGQTGDFSWALKVGSTNVHTEAGVQPNEYIVGADIGFKVPDLTTINTKVTYGAIGDNAVLGFGLNLTLTPIKGLKAVVNADYTNENEINAFDTSVALDYTMDKMFSFGAGFYYGKANLELDPSRMDARVRASLLAVENLSLSAGFDFWEISADPANDPLKVLIGVNSSYKVALEDKNHVTPYANFGYSLFSEGMYLKAGLNAQFFPLTTFGLDYTAGKITTNDISIAPITETDKGIITFKTTIAY